jgi:hypothetical protein
VFLSPLSCHVTRKGVASAAQQRAKLKVKH